MIDRFESGHDCPRDGCEGRMEAEPGDHRYRCSECGRPCVACRDDPYGEGPSHFASKGCKSGKRAHCPCDACF